MNLNITGRNLDISDALKEFVIKKFQKINDKLNEPLTANLVLSIENKNAHVEMHANLNHQTINFSLSNPDMYVAINQLVKKVNRKLNESKPHH